LNVPRGLPVFRVGDVGLEPTDKPSGKPLVLSGGAAESAALDTDLAIVVGAWPLLAVSAKSIIVWIARNAGDDVK
jgi:hypothetical protein